MKTHFVIFYVFLLTSCANIDVVPLFNKNYSIIDPELTELSYTGEKDVPYGDDKYQKYDIFLPENLSEKVPVIVLLHGGGWSKGDKGVMMPWVEYLKYKKVKCAIVNANYRLTFPQQITYKEQLEDIGLLLKTLQKNAKSLNISPKFFLVGMSAGGHLAMLYSYSANKNNLVEAVAGIVSPTDLSSEKLRQGLMMGDINQLIGKPFDEENMAEYKSASPYFHVNKNTLPTILFYGGNDALVSKEQGELMKAKLEKFNVKHEYNFYPDQPHDWFVLHETLDKMIDFADKYL
jgi:acetyl esterase/lipase